MHVCSAASGGFIDMYRQKKREREFWLPSVSCFISAHHCVTGLTALSHTDIQYIDTYSKDTHTQTVYVNVHNCVHSQNLYTGTTTATDPVLSLMMYHSDSLYHTVIAAIFIVTPTVSLSIHPITLNLSSTNTSLLFM